MTTLSELSLQVAKRLMDVLEGTATSGSSSTLLDTNSLTQNGDYWTGGTLWILSGTHSGKVLQVTSYSANKLTFSALASTIGTPTYAVSKSTFPYHIIKSAINSALDETRVVCVDETLTATTDKEYTLPSGVERLIEVETVSDDVVSKKSHWIERDGKVIFEDVPDGTIRLVYLKGPPNLSAYTDEVHHEINTDWLRWAATVNALRWGLRMYQADPSLRVEELLNEAYKKLETLKPKNGTFVRVKTAYSV